MPSPAGGRRGAARLVGPDVPAPGSRLPVVSIQRRMDIAGLTPAEQDVGWLLLRGLTNPEIAAARRCREGTIKNHLTAALGKTRTTNRTALALALLGLEDTCE